MIVSFVSFNRGADKSDEILREYEGDLLAGLGGVHHAGWNVHTHEVNATPHTMLLTKSSQQLFRNSMNDVIILWHTLVLIQSDLSLSLSLTCGQVRIILRTVLKS